MITVNLVAPRKKQISNGTSPVNLLSSRVRDVNFSRLGRVGGMGPSKRLSRTWNLSISTALAHICGRETMVR